MTKQKQQKIDRPLISIIVPVYNVEQYLPACIRSILRQTYQDFELILVDDGSPDSSGAICDEFAYRDSRIRVIHQKNGGVSRARNAGIEVARGEWITFIDADDVVTPRYLEYFLKDVDECVDIICQGSLQLKDGRLSRRVVLQRFLGRLAECVAEPNFMKQTQPWGKLFSRTLILEQGIRFPEGMRWGEDCVFFLDYLVHAKVVATVNSCRYVYNLDNAGSAMKTECSADDLWAYAREVAPRLQRLKIVSQRTIGVFPPLDQIDMIRSALYRCFSLSHSWKIYRNLHQRIQTSLARDILLSYVYGHFYVSWRLTLWVLIVFLFPAPLMYFIFWPVFKGVSSVWTTRWLLTIDRQRKGGCKNICC